MARFARTDWRAYQKRIREAGLAMEECEKEKGGVNHTHDDVSMLTSAAQPKEVKRYVFSRFLNAWTKLVPA